MTSFLTILTTAAGQPATKSFVREHGAITKLPMRMSKYFTVERRAVETINDLATALTELNSSPRQFIIRGEPIPGLNLDHPIRRLKHDGEDNRATLRSSPDGQAWVCLDFDNVYCPDGIFPARDFENAMLYLRDMLPLEFQDVTFWAQLSSSAGIHGWDKMSAHLWFMLDRPITDDRLNAWAIDTDAPIDPRLFNAVQPHFTSAPIFAFDVPDPCPVRCGLIKGSRDVVCLDLPQTNEREGIAENSRASQPHSETTRATPRSERPQPGSRNSQVGVGRRTDQWASSDSAAIILERPLLSGWLMNCFRPKHS